MHVGVVSSLTARLTSFDLGTELLGTEQLLDIISFVHLSLMLRLKLVLQVYLNEHFKFSLPNEPDMLAFLSLLAQNLTTLDLNIREVFSQRGQENIRRLLEKGHLSAV